LTKVRREIVLLSVIVYSYARPLNVLGARFFKMLQDFQT